MMRREVVFGALVALFIVVLGRPVPGRVVAASGPPNAPCGVAGVFDFPVGAPDGADWNVFQSFGNPRAARQGKHHTGEDWGRMNRRSRGQPVYSVAEGQVILSQPWAWGTEKGVILIEHVLADGERLISLYGHLDETTSYPDVGTCVARGQQVGRIGDPDTGPHLHFEIRKVLRGDAGPGYVFEDPLSVGWLNPTDVILRQRSRALPEAEYRYEYVSRTPRDGEQPSQWFRASALRMEVTLRNTGTATWYRDPASAPDGRAVYLATGSALAPETDRLGVLHHASPFFRASLPGWWPDEENPEQARRVRMQELQVAPGELAHFVFYLDLLDLRPQQVRLWMTPSVTELGAMPDVGIRWHFRLYSRWPHRLPPLRSGQVEIPEWETAKRDWITQHREPE